MARKVKIWLKEPGKSIRQTEVEDKLIEYQKLVGGYIECYALSPSCSVVCNEKGIINHLPFNCRIENNHFFGNIFFVGTAGEEFVDCPLNHEDMVRYFIDLFKEETNESI